jgi:hypothetical protein
MDNIENALYVDTESKLWYKIEELLCNDFAYNNKIVTFWDSRIVEDCREQIENYLKGG